MERARTVIPAPAAWAALLLTLAACTGLPLPAPSPTPAVPTLTLSPSIVISAEAVLQPGPGVDEWTVLSLPRSGDAAVGEPRVLIVVFDPSGAEVERLLIDIPLDPLPPRTAWPIRETFQSSTSPASATVSLIGEPGSATASPRVLSEIVTIFVDSSGTPAALGRLEIVGDSAVEILGLHLLRRSEDGTITDILDAAPALSILPAGSETPFLARMPEAGSQEAWEPFLLARPANDPSPRVSLMAAESFTDDQGNPFVTLQLENTSPSPVWIRLTGVLRRGERWLAGREIDIPSPIPVRETAAVSLLLPATAIGESVEPDSVDWEVFLDASPAGAEPVAVPIEVLSYEPAGSTLVLRVRLSAPPETPLDRGAITAVLRSEGGPVVSASWAGISNLGAGESAVVVVSLPLPSGFDLMASALDVSGSGLPSRP